MFLLPSKILFRTPVHPIDQISNIRADFLGSNFEEGLYLSSKPFWSELSKESLKTQSEKKKIDETVLKYWLRSCTRCTPFATFAGSTVIDIAEETNLVIGDSYKHSRLDLSCLEAIINFLLQNEAIKEQIFFFVNNSLHETATGYQYLKRDYGKTDYAFVTLTKESHIGYIIELAKSGVRLDDLCNELQKKLLLSRSEVYSFIGNCIDNQVLVSELQIQLTGEDALLSVINKLSPLKGAENITTTLKQVKKILDHPTCGIAAWEEVGRLLSNPPFLIDLPQNVIHTDLYFENSSARIDRKIIQSLVLQISELSCISSRCLNDDFYNFREHFLKRYEGQEIPLSLAFDVDSGITYGNLDSCADDSDLLQGINSYENQQLNSKIDYVTLFSIEKYDDFLRTGQSYIEISDEDIVPFKSRVDSNRIPSSLYIFGSLLKNEGRIDVDNFLFEMKGFGGPSGANLFGRFTHGNSRMENLANEVIEKEEKANPEVIFAEIVHMPDPRTGNVIQRKCLRNYEISYNGLSGREMEFQLDVTDLMLSMKNGRFVLRSRRLNKIVLPRLTSAHNFRGNSLPIYKFLCDLQLQDCHMPKFWDWGYLQELSSLPRVVYKNIIVKKAQWKIFERDIADTSTDEHYAICLQETLHKRKIPRRVTFGDYDNDMYIDFDNPSHVSLFIRYLKKAKVIKIEEFLFNEDSCIVTDCFDRPYSSELIMPLHRPVDSLPGEVTSIDANCDAVRFFPPGSEWLYYKIYCGFKAAEKLLNEHLVPFIRVGRQNMSFEKFFFIRYKDDFPHLRIRFYNSDVKKNIFLQEEFSRKLSLLQETGLVDKIVIDTYCREIERYCGNLIPHIETLFYFDSLAVLNILQHFDRSGLTTNKLLAAIVGVDCLCQDFGFAIYERKLLIKQLLSGFIGERVPLSMQRNLNAKYRRYQKGIHSHFIREKDIENNFFEIRSIYKLRSRQNLMVIDIIRERISDTELKNLTGSCIHMFINRLFSSNQNRYEIVIYYFLEKYYTSVLAIQRN